MHSVIAEKIVDSILGSQARRAVPDPSDEPAPTLPLAGRARTEPGWSLERGPPRQAGGGRRMVR